MFKHLDNKTLAIHLLRISFGINYLAAKELVKKRKAI